MRKLLFVLALSLFTFQPRAQATTWPGVKPKLVVFIVIDQFRADYLSRFNDRFGAKGFKALMKDGAYFPFGEYDILQSMTGPGHATVLTGAYPYQMGIPLNDWFDQKSKSSMYCVEDPSSEIVGGENGAHTGRSPKNLVGTTLGDELKNSGYQSKVVTVALKDRAAILMGGHRADMAIWFDGENWVTSRYYSKEGGLPNWIGALNAKVAKPKCNLASPCGTEMTVEAFKAELLEFKLGRSSATDLIAVSFSSHDYAGHRFGPNADEMIAMTVSEDRAIASIREAVATAVPGGLKNAVFVLTGDHGIAPTGEYLSKTGIDSGRIKERGLVVQMEQALTKKFGAAKSGRWVPYVNDFNFFIDEDEARSAKIDIAKMEQEMKAVLLDNPAFAQAFTRSEYEAAALPPGQFGRQIGHTYYRGRSGNVIGIQKPFYINDSPNKANHMTGYVYDRMVPILFSGFGIKAGVFADKAEVVDIAPTLSYLVGVLPPALSEGKILKQALK